MVDLISRIADAPPDGSDGSRDRGSSNYPYVTARVRSRRKFLLEDDEYPKLLARDAHEIARTLQEGQYKDEIDQMAGRRSGADLVEHATRRNLAATYRDILDWCQGDLSRMVELYLGRYDVYNLKTLLRGRYADVSAEEIDETLIPAGRMTSEDLEQLENQPTLQDLVEAVPNPTFRSALRDRIDPEDEEIEDLVDLENALDKAYYNELLEAVDPSSKPQRVFRNFLRREVDLLNIKTLLRLRVDDIEDVDAYFVEGGDEVPLDDVRQAAQTPLDELPQVFSGVSFFEEIEEDLETFAETRALDDVMTAMDQFLMESARGFTIRHPLSILPVIDFILQKRAEVHNLRVIAHGKAHDLDDDIIEELLIL
jgi:V/A-type H+-transporting ATPase subunit C